MSHTVTVKIQMTDRAAIEAAVRRMSNTQILAGNTHRLFSGNRDGLGIKLAAWKYPVVINTTTGEAFYDNYEEAWGKQETLDQLMQLYGVEKAKAAAHQLGRTVDEETAENGDITLKVYSLV